MNYAVIVVFICLFSSAVLEQTQTALNDNAEKNSRKMSPKEKLKHERKTIFFGFFGKFLKYGSIVYLLLSVLLEVMRTVQR